MNITKRLEEKFNFLSQSLIMIAPANVVIGISSDVSKDGTACSPQSAAIADKVLEIYERGWAQNVLLTGGHHLRSWNAVTEARAMADRIGHLLPNDRLQVEWVAKNTRKNAEYSLVFMRRNNWDSVIIVAHPIHALRVQKTFKKLWKKQGIWKIRVVSAPSPYGGGSQRRWQNFYSFLIWDRLIAMPLFKLRGWI
ncbi:MAG: YdcF family protein [bacterium]|nr:YdcF family protein [bacterium]